MEILVFDPPMCCSSGVCGPSVDPELARFSADIEWLTRQGATVKRYNLSQQPAEFVGHPVVKEALGTEGDSCLPLILAGGNVVSKGRYPSRDILANAAGIPVTPSIFSEQVKELVAIGAAIGSNCEMCFKYHFGQARKLGISKEDIRLAVDMAKMVKDSPARSIAELADKVLTLPAVKATAGVLDAGCCSPGSSTSGGRCC
jgi:AhpD family alkylhydroperoxidase